MKGPSSLSPDGDRSPLWLVPSKKGLQNFQKTALINLLLNFGLKNWLFKIKFWSFFLEISILKNLSPVLKPRQRLRSVGPVVDLSSSSHLEDCLSQSLQRSVFSIVSSISLSRAKLKAINFWDSRDHVIIYRT